MKKLLLFGWLAVSSALAQTTPATNNAAPTTPKEDAQPEVADIPKAPDHPVNPALPTLFIIGDSTVEHGKGLQVGWGLPFADYFDPSKINVVNRAIGGRSARNFQAEGRWDKVLADSKPGDFVIMQFGHNDGGDPKDPLKGDRGDLKGVGEETIQAKNPKTQQMDTVHTYGWYMRKYVTDAQAKKLIPIICSPVPHKDWTSDGKVVRDAADYGGWARAVAQSTGAYFVDLNEISAERYEALGKDKVATLFFDARTHANAAGADLNAQSVVAGLKGIPKCPLIPYLSDKASAIAPFIDPGAAATSAVTAPVKHDQD
jgi:lysophospholipase L1-like esterase